MKVHGGITMLENSPIGIELAKDQASGGELTPKSDTKPPSDTISKQELSSIPMSSSSTKPSQGLSKRWRKPTTVKEFVSQINEVSTRILNNEIDMDVANSYARMTRSFAQLMTTETVKARFLKSQPDLNLDGKVFEDENA